MKEQLVFKNIALELILLAVGCILYAFSVVLFIDPAQVIPGSVTGIAVILKQIFNTQIGVVNLIINVPLIAIAVFFLGKKFLVYTILTILSTSVLMDFLAPIGAMTDDRMLASIFGGVVMGVGLGLILRVGSSTGGTTVVGRLVLLKKPNIPIGDILLIGDFLIILIGSFFLKDGDSFLLSLINLYICVIFINKVVYFGEEKASITLETTKAEIMFGKLLEKIPSVEDLRREENRLIFRANKKDLSLIERISKEEDSSCNTWWTDIHKN